jgi:uncharacterized membrane protein YtjA (UPF0391 family)
MLLTLAIVFAVVALAAALLGFRNLAGLSADFAKLFLLVFVVLVVISVVLAAA